MEEQFPSNSRTVKVVKPPTIGTNISESPETSDRPKIEQIATATKRKKSPGKRFKEMIFQGEDARTVFTTIRTDIVGPTIRSTIGELAIQSIEAIFMGGPGGSHRPSVGGALVSTAKNVAYNKMASTTIRPDPRVETRPSISHQARRTHDFGEIVLGSRAEGNEVIRRLEAIIQKYDHASVNELYEMVGITGDYTGEKWGWDNIQGAHATRDRRTGGYVLSLPAPIEL